MKGNYFIPDSRVRLSDQTRAQVSWLIFGFCCDPNRLRASQMATSPTKATYSHPNYLHSPAQYGFVQEGPRLGNQYLEDSALRDLLKRLLPQEVLSEIEDDLIRFGDR